MPSAPALTRVEVLSHEQVIANDLIHEVVRLRRGCVCVGATGLLPEERFANHKVGHKAIWYAQALQ